LALDRDVPQAKCRTFGQIFGIQLVDNVRKQVFLQYAVAAFDFALNLGQTSQISEILMELAGARTSPGSRALQNIA
jgi:hypothetical protein